MEGSGKEGVDLAGSYSGAVIDVEATSAPQENQPGGYMGILPPETIITVTRKEPIWARGIVDDFQLGDAQTLTEAHVSQVRKHYGGGVYQFKGTIGGKFVSGSTCTLRFQGQTLQKGRPHPADPDIRHEPQAALGSPAQPQQQWQPAVGQAPAPTEAHALFAQLQWMQSQIESLSQGRVPVPPPAQLPPGYQAPPGFQLVPLGGVPPAAAPGLPTYGTPAAPFAGAMEFMNFMKAVREFDGRAPDGREYETDDDDDDETETETPAADGPMIDGMKMPTTLEESMAALVYMKAREIQQGQAKKEAGENPYTLVRDGKTVETAEPTPATTPATTTAAATPAAAPAGIEAALAQLKSLPPEQQATLLLQVTNDVTKDPEVAKHLQRIATAAAGGNSGAA